jgi:hypothetical protein
MSDRMGKSLNLFDPCHRNVNKRYNAQSDLVGRGNPLPATAGLIAVVATPPVAKDLITQPNRLAVNWKTTNGKQLAGSDIQSVQFRVKHITAP